MRVNMAIRLMLLTLMLVAETTFIGPNQALASVVITVPESATVWGDRIWLTELADVKGDGPEVASTQRTLARISLGPSPRPGETRSISKAVIEARIRQASKNADYISLALPTKVTITRAAHYVESDDVEAALKQYIRTTFALAEAEITVDGLRIHQRLAVPTGPKTLKFKPLGSQAPLGDTTLNLAVMQGPNKVASSRVSANIQVSAPIVILGHNVPRGRELGPDDLELAVMPINRLSGTPFFSLDQAEGLATRISLKEGAILTQKDVVLPPVVAKGDMVTILVRSRGVTLTAPGHARADGHPGDVIAVYSEETQKLLRAKVLQDGLVEVSYRAPVALSNGSLR